MSTFFTKPSVRLIAYTQMDQSEVYGFLKDHGLGWPVDSQDDIDLVSEFGGKICYMSFAGGRKSNKEYIGHMLEMSHGSTFEHGAFNFAITNVSRSLTHELVRHRAGCGFSQLSQRYVDESTAEYVVAPLFQHPDVVEQYKEDIEKVHEFYLKWSKIAGELIDKHYPGLQGTDKRKNARQAARYFLPNATETKLLFTCNARALRNILELRASPHADVEIRNLAMQLYRLAKEKAPSIFQDYVVVDLNDGTQCLESKFRKV